MPPKNRLDWPHERGKAILGAKTLRRTKGRSKDDSDSE